MTAASEQGKPEADNSIGLLEKAHSDAQTQFQLLWCYESSR